jgi:hypothetical protein
MNLQKSLDTIASLIVKGEDLSPEESTLWEALAILVESYEETEFARTSDRGRVAQNRQL